MAVTAMTLSAERWLDEVSLLGAVGGAGGANLTEQFTLPSGLGDVAIMNVIVRVPSIDVLKAAAAIGAGVRAFILSGDAVKVVDNVGVSAFLLVQDTANALEVAAYVEPDALVLWRQSEQLWIAAPEIDSDATPLGNLSVYVKAVRVRPIETVVRGPVRLVRSVAGQG